MSSENTRDRILAVYKILQGADENTAMTRDQVITALDADYGIKTAKGTLTEDLKALLAAGLIRAKYPEGQLGRGVYGRFETNYFETWELKILMDAVAQVPYLRYEDVCSIRETLLHMTSEQNRKDASRNTVTLESAAYACSTEFRDNLATVLAAISEGKKIRFNHSKLGEDKRRLPDSKPARIVSPYYVTINGNFFYLIGYTEEESGGTLKVYRVDRIVEPAIMPDKRIKMNETPDGDLTELVKKYISNNTSNFLGSDPAVVTVRLDKSRGADAAMLFDKMGIRNVNRVNGQENTFTITSRDTDGLYYNLMSLADSIEVLGPPRVREKYLELLHRMADKYNI